MAMATSAERSSNDDGGRIRFDKWLWAARFYKTRALAVDAIESGKIEVNGERSKRAKLVQSGDTIRIRMGPYEHVVAVRGVSDKRGPAAAAALLYEEEAESKKAREAMALHMKAMRVDTGYDSGRPTKKDRREIERLKRR